jgi:hypothetical protein
MLRYEQMGIYEEQLDPQARARAEEKTRELVKRFVELDVAERYEDCYRMLNPDGRFIFIGECPASGVYHGPDDLLSRLAPLLATYRKRPNMTFSEAMICGNRAFLRASSSGAEGLYGPYAQPYYGFYLRVKGDGFDEIVEFLDPMQLEVSLFGTTMTRRPEYQ